MAEIVFPCKCAMILKVYGDDQIGQGIVCPSCGSTVIVPPVGMAVDDQAPLVADALAAPKTASMSGKWLGLGYLAGVGVVTVGLIKYILMPALAPPVAVPQVALAQNDPPEVPTKESESDDAPRRLLKKPRGGTLTKSAERADVSRKPEAKPKSSSLTPTPPPPTAERKDRGATAKRVGPAPRRPVDESEKFDEIETAPPTPLDVLQEIIRQGMVPGGPRRRPGRMPTGPGGDMGKAAPRGLPPPPGGLGGGLARKPAAPRPDVEAAPEASEPDEPPDPSKSSTPPEKPGSPGSDAESPAKARRISKDDTTAKTIKKSTGKKSAYEHIENKEARQALEAAALNTTNYLATYTAENFLRRAEKLGAGDPEVLAEIKRLRKKIDAMRK
jgi:DNA-directed RNA polymerase subunit RPC12/RpoP